MDEATTSDGITVFGAMWCGDTRRSLALLDGLGIEYAFVDVDLSQEASDWAAAQNGGKRRIPVIVVAPGQPILIEPSDLELSAALQEAGLAPAIA
ncbi:MAG: glutaredoxin family protein [Chloroflexota bacterium]|nr:glutaredoxin family protein [Chloroflexota bacterium]